MTDVTCHVLLQMEDGFMWGMDILDSISFAHLKPKMVELMRKIDAVPSLQAARAQVQNWYPCAHAAMHHYFGCGTPTDCAHVTA